MYNQSSAPDCGEVAKVPQKSSEITEISSVSSHIRQDAGVDTWQT